MALSFTGNELWPPGFVASRWKSWYTFSLACTSLVRYFPFRMLPPPPSLIANSASIRSLWFLTSHSAPLKEPPSSSAVSARMMSRSGLNPSSLSRIRLAMNCEAIALPSLVQGHRLFGAGAAAVEETFFFDEGERIHRPVLAFRVDDVEVREEEEWLACAGAAEAKGQVFFPRARPR